MTKETGFHQSFAKHTRHFVEYNGYWLADQVAAAGPVDEYHACVKDALFSIYRLCANLRSPAPMPRPCASIFSREM